MSACSRLRRGRKTIVPKEHAEPAYPELTAREPRYSRHHRSVRAFHAVECEHALRGAGSQQSQQDRRGRAALSI